MAHPNDLIGYDALQQEALRGVIRAVLKLVSAKGPPGDHHFLITFKTTAPGVTMPKELLAQYPDEMRIALQHQYWDLAPGETFFSVTLKFGGQPKSLSIPYTAITHFWDQAVDYQLRFTVSDAPPAPTPALAPQPLRALAPTRPTSTDDADKPADGPNIVSLDHFRKK